MTAEFQVRHYLDPRAACRSIAQFEKGAGRADQPGRGKVIQTMLQETWERCYAAMQDRTLGTVDSDLGNAFYRFTPLRGIFILAQNFIAEDFGVRGHRVKDSIGDKTGRQYVRLVTAINSGKQLSEIINDPLYKRLAPEAFREFFSLVQRLGPNSMDMSAARIIDIDQNPQYITRMERVMSIARFQNMQNSQIRRSNEVLLKFLQLKRMLEETLAIFQADPLETRNKTTIITLLFTLIEQLNGSIEEIQTLFETLSESVEAKSAAFDFTESLQKSGLGTALYPRQRVLNWDKWFSGRTKLNLIKAHRANISDYFVTKRTAEILQRFEIDLRGFKRKFEEIYAEPQVIASYARWIDLFHTLADESANIFSPAILSRMCADIDELFADKVAAPAASVKKHAMTVEEIVRYVEGDDKASASASASKKRKKKGKGKKATPQKPANKGGAGPSVEKPIYEQRHVETDVDPQLTRVLPSSQMQAFEPKSPREATMQLHLCALMQIIELEEPMNEASILRVLSLSSLIAESYLKTHLEKKSALSRELAESHHLYNLIQYANDIPYRRLAACSAVSNAEVAARYCGRGYQGAKAAFVGGAVNGCIESGTAIDLIDALQAHFKGETTLSSHNIESFIRELIGEILEISKEFVPDLNFDAYSIEVNLTPQPRRAGNQVEIVLNQRLVDAKAKFASCWPELKGPLFLEIIYLQMMLLEGRIAASALSGGRMRADLLEAKAKHRLFTLANGRVQRLTRGEKELLLRCPQMLQVTRYLPETSGKESGNLSIVDEARVIANELISVKQKAATVHNAEAYLRRLEAQVASITEKVM